VAPVARRRPVARIPFGPPRPRPARGDRWHRWRGAARLRGPLRSGRRSVTGDTCGEARPQARAHPWSAQRDRWRGTLLRHWAGVGEGVLPGPHRAHGSDGRSYASQSKTRELTAPAQRQARVFRETLLKHRLARLDTCQMIANNILSASIIYPMLYWSSATQRGRTPPQDAPDCASSRLSARPSARSASRTWSS
jgi:hypothetical protein